VKSESVVFASGEVGPLTTAGTFRYEVEKAENDQYGNRVTTVKCHGKLAARLPGNYEKRSSPCLPLADA
jgi:hypothetical protein